MSQVSSDKNTDGRRPLDVVPTLFADLSLEFANHPSTNDIRPITDLNAIRQSVKNLVLTNFGERPFQPEIGCNATALLFENADFFTASVMKTEIERVLHRNEPRIQNIVVQIFDDIERNAIKVDVGFQITESSIEQEVSFYLTRVR
jgi:phage baseplate assembly protein W